LPDLRRRPNRPQRVILVHDRDAEHRHHRIPNELLHRPTVALDDCPHLGEVPVENSAQHLRIELLPQRRRPRHIAKQRRHNLPRLARRSRLLQGSSARPTEAKALRALRTTPCTNHHAPHILRPPPPKRQPAPLILRNGPRSATRGGHPTRVAATPPAW